jgi:AcrR family transcriptional regulator
VSSETPPATAARLRLDREERKRQLVEAYKYLIATKGYASTGLRDVAQHVGISTGTLLHHFRSKEELLTATLLAVAEDFLEHMREAVVDEPDPAVRLKKLVEAVFESPRHDIGWRVWMAFWHESGSNAQLASVASEQTNAAERVIAEVIADGTSSGHFSSSDPDRSAAELAALVDGVAIRLYGETGRWSREQALAVLGDRINGLAGT